MAQFTEHLEGWYLSVLKTYELVHEHLGFSGLHLGSLASAEMLVVDATADLVVKEHIIDP